MENAETAGTLTIYGEKSFRETQKYKYYNFVLNEIPDSESVTPLLFRGYIRYIDISGKEQTAYSEMVVKTDSAAVNKPQNWDNRISKGRYNANTS